jgi:hypothetical protein
MKQFAVQAKKGQNKDKAERIFAQIWDKQVSGAQYELIVRHLLTVKGLRTATVRGKGKVDQTIKLNGKVVRIELKTGTGICATVGAKFGDHITNYSAEDIYPDADIVIFAPGADDFTDMDQVLYESLVFMSPKAFAEYVIANSGKRKHAFETAFKLAVDSKVLREKNAAIAPREITDPKTGEKKYTKRGLERWTDCIVMQEAYNNQLVEAVIENATDELTLGQFLMDIGRYEE